MTIYDDYIQIHNDHASKYGDKTILFMQVGDFFEVYAVQNETERAGADIFTLADLCNLQVTRKNKSIADVSRSNPYMAGFPLHALDKHVQTLVQFQYTVVIVRQVTPPPKVQREVTDVISPSTYVSGSIVKESNYLVVFYWECPCRVGIAGVDVSTGSTWVYEVGATPNDPSFAIDEAFRILHTYDPKEVVVLSSCDANGDIQDVFTSNRFVTHNMLNKYDKIIEKVAYQNAMLTKAYSDDVGSILTPLELLNIECMDLGRIAFTYMLQFAYEHNDKIIGKLHKPYIVSKEKFMNLQYTSALQLNVISNQPGERSLMHFLNRCATSFGSRAFRDRLLLPSQDVHVIAKRYQDIDNMLRNDTWQLVSKALSRVLDLERLSRRVVLGSLSPFEWNAIHESLEACKEAVAYLPDMETNVSYQIDKFQKLYTTVLDLQECSKYNLNDIQGTVFQKGIFIDIDEIHNQSKADIDKLEELASKVTDIGNGDATLCRVDCNDRDGYYLTMTRKRFDSAMKLSPEFMCDCEFDTRPISSTSTILKITNNNITETSNRIISNKWKLQTMVTKHYRDFLASFDVSSIYDIISFITQIDIAATCAKNAKEYGYCRPTLVSGKSSIEGTGIRHPIIERIQESIEYVKNDVNIGITETGLLLYGINASGKSSYMKAIGLNIIMAQAGMYVASSSFKYSPFSHVFTRISGMDNIYRGLSSFTVEMSELRNILQRCDEKSLVLGDELCAGTESVSAIAIVGAGVHHLLQKKTCFVFATHLHELTDIAILKDQPHLGVYHMHIEIDKESGKIVYERKLKPGRGVSVYGLEVCEALLMPDDFLKVAHKVRREIQNVASEVVAGKVSRYNANVVVDVCMVCKQHRASDTHHIRYQHTAQDNGFVADGVHMNNACNLIPVCQECHDKEHRGEIHIQGYVQTSRGIKVKVSKQYTENNCIKEAYSLEDIISRSFKGNVEFTLNGWRERSDKTKRWKMITEESLYTKLGKFLGRPITEDEFEVLRSELRAL